MKKYIIQRILLMLLTMFVIMTMCFMLIKLLPLPAVKARWAGTSTWSGQKESRWATTGR